MTNAPAGLQPRGSRERGGTPEPESGRWALLAELRRSIRGQWFLPILLFVIALGLWVPAVTAPPAPAEAERPATRQAPLPAVRRAHLAAPALRCEDRDSRDPIIEIVETLAGDWPDAPLVTTGRLLRDLRREDLRPLFAALRTNESHCIRRGKGWAMASIPYEIHGKGAPERGEAVLRFVQESDGEWKLEHVRKLLREGRP